MSYRARCRVQMLLRGCFADRELYCGVRCCSLRYKRNFYTFCVKNSHPVLSSSMTCCVIHLADPVSPHLEQELPIDAVPALTNPANVMTKRLPGSQLDFPIRVLGTKMQKKAVRASLSRREQSRVETCIAPRFITLASSLSLFIFFYRVSNYSLLFNA